MIGLTWCARNLTDGHIPRKVIRGMVDDPDRAVIEPLAAATGRLPRLYDTELMLGGGRVTGHFEKVRAGQAGR